jgi:hypothetical protein
MKQRGRKSAKQQMGVVIDGGFGQRPEPLPEMTPRQAEIWRQTVASEPFDFFSSSTSRNMLKDLCRYREAIENISQIIDSFDPLWLKNAEGSKRYLTLLKMRDLESKAMARMATKLRLTNQSRYTPQAAGTAGRNAASGLKPWEM